MVERAGSGFPYYEIKEMEVEGGQRKICLFVLRQPQDPTQGPAVPTYGFSTVPPSPLASEQ